MKLLLIGAAIVHFVASYVTSKPSVSTSFANPQPPIAIIRLNNDNRGDGRYKFDFETENHIQHQEVGELRNAGTDHETNAIQGSYSYTGPDGVTYTVNYVADEHGFRATGDHIPTAAPIPAEIVEALELNAAEEARGVVDDGQYRPHYHKTPPHKNRNH